MFNEDDDWSDAVDVIHQNVEKKKPNSATVKSKNVVGKKSFMRTLQTLGSIPEWKSEIQRPGDSDSDTGPGVLDGKKTRKKTRKKRVKVATTTTAEPENNVDVKTEKNVTKEKKVVKKKVVPNGKSAPAKDGARKEAPQEDAAGDGFKLSRQQWRNKIKNKKKCKNKFRQDNPPKKDESVAKPLPPTRSITKTTQRVETPNGQKLPKKRKKTADVIPSVLPAKIPKKKKEETVNSSMQKEEKVNSSMQKEQKVKVSMQKEQKVKVSMQKEQKVNVSMQKEQKVKVSMQKEQKVNVSMQKEQKVKVSIQKEQKVKVSMQKEQKVNVSIQKEQKVKVSMQKEQKVNSPIQKEQKVNSPIQKEQKVNGSMHESEDSVSQHQLNKAEMLKRGRLRQILCQENPEELGEPKEDPTSDLQLSSEPSLSDLRSSELRLRMQQRLDSGRFRYINELLYSTNSGAARRMFNQDPEAFHIYHRGYTAQVSRWPINPVDDIIAYIKSKPASVVVADFGCGDCKIARSVKNKVHSYDLVATSELATVCDMAKVPLEDRSIGIAVFCLSLMGTNLIEFLSEANRVLKRGGFLKIAEVASRFENVQDFVNTMARLGFKLLSKDTENTHFYSFEFLKTADVPEKVKKLSLTLKACLYKKR
ncbi:uncharacterized protein rrp8 [Stigmatopora nigra]